jgi:hypothetical protein
LKMQKPHEPASCMPVRCKAAASQRCSRAMQPLDRMQQLDNLHRSRACHVPLMQTCKTAPYERNGLRGPAGGR